MIADKNGKKVKEGDVIEFSNTYIPYKVILKDGLLGSYENGEFIALEDCLRNFVIINR